MLIFFCVTTSKEFNSLNDESFSWTTKPPAADFIDKLLNALVSFSVNTLRFFFDLKTSSAVSEKPGAITHSKKGLINFSANALSTTPLKPTIPPN